MYCGLATTSPQEEWSDEFFGKVVELQNERLIFEVPIRIAVMNEARDTAA